VQEVAADGLVGFPGSALDEGSAHIKGHSESDGRSDGEGAHRSDP
jgi:hypothetical protein